MTDFRRAGWTGFPYDAGCARWAVAARAAGLQALEDAALRRRWLTCGGTWFVGVDVLPNAPDGSVDGVPLAGPAVGWITGQGMGVEALHPAQLSVIWPGYPRPREDEGEAAFRYRLKRDAAHVDGLKRQRGAGARVLEERHAWILGLPLTDCGAGASPFVVWEGSHEVMRRAFREVFAGLPEADWGRVDVSARYAQARREVFETCRRVEISTRPGEAYLVHRLALHGVAPWADGATAPEAGRMVAYFRPHLPAGADWLESA